MLFGLCIFIFFIFFAWYIWKRNKYLVPQVHDLALGFVDASVSEWTTRITWRKDISCSEITCSEIALQKPDLSVLSDPHLEVEQEVVLGVGGGAGSSWKPTAVIMRKTKKASAESSHEIIKQLHEELKRQKLVTFRRLWEWNSRSLASQPMWMMVASILNMGPGITNWVNNSIMKVEFEVSVHIQEKYSQGQRIRKESIERGETKLSHLHEAAKKWVENQEENGNVQS